MAYVSPTSPGLHIVKVWWIGKEERSDLYVSVSVGLAGHKKNEQAIHYATYKFKKKLKLKHHNLLMHVK